MITLKPISYKNIWKTIALNVASNQTSFVATNTQSILEAYIALSNDTVALPYAILNDDEIVGFVMLGYGHNGDDADPDIAHNNYCIWRFMIDESYQNKGYGKEALIKVFELLKTCPKGFATHCWLSYEAENTVAKKFYAAFGFEENGAMCGNEIVAVKKI